MIHTVAAVVDVAVAKIVSVNATRRNKMKITKKQLKQIIKEELSEDANAKQYELQKNSKIQQAIYDLEDRVMPVLYGTDLEPMVNSLHKAMYRKVSGR